MALSGWEMGSPRENGSGPVVEAPAIHWSISIESQPTARTPRRSAWGNWRFFIRL